MHIEVQRVAHLRDAWGEACFYPAPTSHRTSYAAFDELESLWIPPVTGLEPLDLAAPHRPACPACWVLRRVWGCPFLGA